VALTLFRWWLDAVPFTWSSQRWLPFLTTLQFRFSERAAANSSVAVIDVVRTNGAFDYSLLHPDPSRSVNLVELSKTEQIFSSKVGTPCKTLGRFELLGTRMVSINPGPVRGTSDLPFGPSTAFGRWIQQSFRPGGSAYTYLPDEVNRRNNDESHKLSTIFPPLPTVTGNSSELTEFLM
jgi:hypothetical protein